MDVSFAGSRMGTIREGCERFGLFFGFSKPVPVLRMSATFEYL
jgi:hypothetical protein